MKSIPVLRRLDEHCRRFIALSPFLCISSSRRDGYADASPRGDAPGFVRVVDDSTLIVPDRPGNNRLDTMFNILTNPHVGLMFLVPGRDEILRVNGTAAIRRDEALLAQAEARGKRPKVVLVVHVDEAFLHCGKAVRRAGLWDPQSYPDTSTLPSVGRMLADQIADPDLKGMAGGGRSDVGSGSWRRHCWLRRFARLDDRRRQRERRRRLCGRQR